MRPAQIINCKLKKQTGKTRVLIQDIKYRIGILNESPNRKTQFSNSDVRSKTRWRHGRFDLHPEVKRQTGNAICQSSKARQKVKRKLPKMLNTSSEIKYMPRKYAQAQKLFTGLTRHVLNNK